jgi:hypothetical protein
VWRSMGRLAHGCREEEREGVAGDGLELLISACLFTHFAGAQIHHHHYLLHLRLLCRRHASRLRLQQDSVRPRISQHNSKHDFSGFSQLFQLQGCSHHRTADS